MSESCWLGVKNAFGSVPHDPSSRSQGEHSRPVSHRITNPATSLSEDLLGWLADRDPTAANSNTSDDLTYRISENKDEVS